MLYEYDFYTMVMVMTIQASHLSSAQELNNFTDEDARQSALLQAKTMGEETRKIEEEIEAARKKKEEEAEARARQLEEESKMVSYSDIFMECIYCLLARSKK